MTTAILEILGLLTISCAIGVFFTYRYWNEKYAVLQDQLDEIKSQLSKVSSELNSAKTKNTSLQSDLKAKEDKVIQLQTDLDRSTGKTKLLKKDLEKAHEIRSSLEKQQDATAAKISSLEKEITKLKKPKVVKKSTEDKKKVEKINELMASLKEQMEAKEREIEALSLELEKRKISYYKQIDGKRYKAITITMADKAVAGKGDGRISMEDAQEIFDTISDGKAYTQVEKDTMRYLRDHYKWTDSADTLFRKKVRSWAAKGHELN